MPTTTDPSVTLRRGGLTFRPATLDDAAFAADVATATHPDEPEDPASWRHWWSTDDPTWTNERFIVLRGNTPIGYARHNHAPWDQMKKRYGRIGFDLLPAERTDAQLATVFDAMEERAQASGTRIFAAYARGDDAASDVRTTAWRAPSLAEPRGSLGTGGRCAPRDEPSLVGR